MHQGRIPGGKKKGWQMTHLESPSFKRYFLSIFHRLETEVAAASRARVHPSLVAFTTGPANRDTGQVSNSRDC